MKKNDSLADEMSGGKPMRRKSNHDYRTIVTIIETKPEEITRCTHNTQQAGVLWVE